MNVVLFGTVMQTLLGVPCSELTIEGNYMDEYVLPPIIEQQIGQNKIFMLYFKTRGALIDSIVVKFFDDDEAATSSPSLLVPPELDLVSSSLRSTGIRYKILSHL